MGPMGPEGTCVCGGGIPDDYPPPEVPEGYDPACYRANLIITFLKKVIDMLAVAAGEEAALINMLPAFFAVMGLVMATGGIGGLIIPVLNLFIGTSGAAILLLFDETFWGELKEYVYNSLYPDGNMTEASYQCLINLVSAKEGINWTFVKSVFQLAHLNGIQNMESTATGDDSGCDDFSVELCPSSETFDFTVSPGPFIPYQFPAGTPLATWTEGVGWVGGYNQYNQAVLCISTDRNTGDWKFEGLDLYGRSGGDDGIYHIDWVTAELRTDGGDNVIISADILPENDFALHYSYTWSQAHYIVVKIQFGTDPLAVLTSATIHWRGWAPWVE